MAEWDPDARLESLAQELDLHDGDQKVTAEAIFKENLALAAQSISHIALYSLNDKTRLDAAKYVVERNLGRIQDSDPSSESDVWNNLLREVVKDGS